MSKLILASTSIYRKELLEKTLIPFECQKSQVDETPYKESISNPKELAAKLARLKAESVFKLNPNSIVIGADQVCHLNGTVLSKPGSFEKARGVLNLLSGKTHELISSYHIISKKKQISHTQIIKLTMKSLNLTQIENYLRSDEPYSCAGSYMIEKSGICLFDQIECDDHTGIIGLPMIQLTKDLAEFNFKLLS